MNHARSGELSVELGHHEPNANKACRKNDNVLDRRRKPSSLRLAMRQVLDSVAFGWPPDRGELRQDEPEGIARPLPARRAELELGRRA